MAETTERLLLQVDASIELLKRGLAGAEAPLSRFERRAARTQETVERSIGSMGGRFGDFARLADDAATRAEASFTASFAQVQRVAAQAIKGPTVDGRVNLGVDDIRAGAAAAQEQARSFGLIEEAARAAAARVGDTSDATRLFIQATTASRIEAERKAQALLAEAGALERVEIELMQSADAAELFVTKHQRVAQAAADQQRLALAADQSADRMIFLAGAADRLHAELDPMFAAQQRFNQALDLAEELLGKNIISTRVYEAAIAHARAVLFDHATAIVNGGTALDTMTDATGRAQRGQSALRQALLGSSYQVQDVITQWSMGGNILQVVAIQAAQLGGQFATLDPAAGKAAARLSAIGMFMTGLPGLALTAALAFTPMIQKLLDFADAEEDALDKLKKDAEQSEATSRAKERFAHSIEGVSAAIIEQRKTLDDSAASERSAAERANIAAKAKRDEALAIRQATQARLADALAAKQAQDDSAFANLDQRTAGIARRDRDQTVAALEAKLKLADKAVTDAERNLNLTRVDLAAENAAISIDPVRSVTRAYDDRIRALKAEQREQAKLGQQVGAESQRRLEQLEREKKKAVEAAQARQSAERSSSSANRQTGRQITVDDARRIVAGIGGRVTSGTRTRRQQEDAYARYQAGTGPLAARPGTSLHETGGAVDIAKSGGVTLAKIRKAFADQGVRLTELLDEGTHFHAGFGKKGASAGTVQRQAEAARQKVLSDDIRFVDEERAARRRLAEAKGRSADSEEELDRITREDINADIDALNRKVRLQQGKGQLEAAEADSLVALNEQTRQQRLQNVAIARATRTIDARFASEQQDAETRLAMLRLSQDMAVTDADRRQIGHQILELEQQLRRQTLERVRATSQDPAEVQRASDALAQLPAVEQRETDAQGQRDAGPVEQYRDRLKKAAGDMDAALEDVKANGLQSLEDGLFDLISGTESAGGAFRKMANGIISDLIRIAARRAILSLLGGSFLGRADGGPVPGRADGGPVPGFARGGSPGGMLRGPGTGRSDSILALLAGGRGAIRVSNGEYIVNAQATREYLPLIEAINQRRLPKFATGGAIGRMPTLPSLRAPALPAPGRGGGAPAGRMQLEGSIAIRPSPLFEAQMESVSVRTIGAAAEPIMAGAQARTVRGLRRERLPGGWG